MSFDDHFSGHASGYARHRPGYPESLFAYIASIAPARDLAWDCATGNGQAAISLTRYFQRVIATDASGNQIEHAIPHERVSYAVAPAEHTAIESASLDAVTVAQAVHWFHLDAFYAEVGRVLKPDGVLAVWAYGGSLIDPVIDKLLIRLNRDILGRYWSEKVGLVDKRYSTLPFPFREIEAPEFMMEAVWSLDDLMGYLSSWSAWQKFMQQEGRDPIDEIRDELSAAWGSPGLKRDVRWKVHLRTGRK